MRFYVCLMYIRFESVTFFSCKLLFWLEKLFLTPDYLVIFSGIQSVFPWVQFVTICISLTRNNVMLCYIILKDTQNPSCIWKEIHHTDGYNYYESDQHNGFFLALKRRGDPKNGRETALGQVSCAFLVTTITHNATWASCDKERSSI